LEGWNPVSSYWAGEVHRYLAECSGHEFELVDKHGQGEAQIRTRISSTDMNQGSIIQTTNFIPNTDSGLEPTESVIVLSFKEIEGLERVQALNGTARVSDPAHLLSNVMLNLQSSHLVDATKVA
jgi:hypothetical protein